MIMSSDDLIQRIYKNAYDAEAVLTPVTEKTLESHLKRFEYGDDKHRRAAKAIRLRYYEGKTPKEIGQYFGRCKASACNYIREGIMYLVISFEEESK